MTVITKELGTLADGQETPGYMRVQIDYDDGTLLIGAVRCINDSNLTAHLDAARTSGGRTYSADIPAGQTQALTIGSSQALRLQLLLTPSGKLDGVDWHCALV